MLALEPPPSRDIVAAVDGVLARGGEARTGAVILPTPEIRRDVRRLLEPAPTLCTKARRSIVGLTVYALEGLFLDPL